MRKLRQSLHRHEPWWLDSWMRDQTHPGWDPQDPAHPCTWYRVQCNSQRRITRLDLGESRTSEVATRRPRGTPASPPVRQDKLAIGAGPLLPELAQLEWLEQLLIVFPSTGYFNGSIPAEWGATGAFPRLNMLWMVLPELNPPLPDIQPGALDALTAMHIDIAHLQATLPVGWGSSPAVLPSLHELLLRMHVIGQLPPEWARGFNQLRILKVQGTTGYPCTPSWRAADAQAADLQGPPRLLPSQWADGGFPALSVLELSQLELEGPIPISWQERSFPALRHLVLTRNLLSGSLPGALLDWRPSLLELRLECNLFSGTLPATWGAHQQITWLYLSGNLLTGPAFPEDWLHDGALPKLTFLILSGNPALTGTLPDTLPWPRLNSLQLDGSGVEGSIPAGWCNTSLANSLKKLRFPNTTIELPSCFKSTMPSLAVAIGELDPNFEDESNAYTPQLSTIKEATYTLAVVASAGAVLALTVGFVLQHARRKKQAATSQQRCGMHTMHGDRQHRRAARTTLKPSTTIRNVLTAQLSTALGGQNSMPIVLLEGLPRPFVHDLRSPPQFALRHAQMSITLPATASNRQSAFSNSPPGWPDSDARPLLPRSGTGIEMGGWQMAVATTTSTEYDRSWIGSLELRSNELSFVVDEDEDLIVLGEGAHAVVYLGHLSNVLVAVKVFQFTPADLLVAFREAQLLRHCKSDRIVPLYGVGLKGNMLMLVMELMQGGSLNAALSDPEKKERLRWHAGGRQVALDVAEGLWYLHTTFQLAHNDLKSSNVLLTEDFRGALSEFGVAQMMYTVAPNAAGFTVVYAAPEVLAGERCTLASDMYSFGVMLVELTTHTLMCARGEWQLPVVPKECPQEVADLIRRCLSLDPNGRPTAAEALHFLQQGN